MIARTQPAVTVLLAASLAAAPVGAYPLDGYAATGIGRLLGYQLVLDGKIPGTLRIPPGGLHGMDDVRLRLAGVNETFDISPSTKKDAALQAGLERVFAARDPSYGIALLDITDPRNPRYAALRETQERIPGSVGKLLVATGLLGAVAQRFPNQTDARRDFLRETVIEGGEFVHRDGKTAPFFKQGDAQVVNRRIESSDKLNLYSWIDHMMSPSSNASGSVVWREALLLRHFGKDYPATSQARERFFAETPKTELRDRALEALEAPLSQSGLDTERLRLGTFFTRNASAVIPGTGSYACPLELMRWLIRVEQGKLIDAWSSLEMKRLMYFSRSRYRYASSPRLNDALVFFKSGSLFQCEPEEGFTCKAYAGNKLNLMHSVAIIESGERVYLVTMMSNVLRVNSAVEHQSVAGEIEKLIQSLP